MFLVQSASGWMPSGKDLFQCVFLNWPLLLWSLFWGTGHNMTEGADLGGQKQSLKFRVTNMKSLISLDDDL
jgi:hypothetical protein